MSHDLLTAEEEIRLARAIEAGLLADHLLTGDTAVTAQVAAVPATTEELLALVVAGREAWQQMWSANLRLTWSLAARHHRRFGGDLDEMVQEAQVGLAEALMHWDHARGSRFSSCAWWWINSRIGSAQREQRRHFNELSRIGEVPEVSDPGAVTQFDRWVGQLPSDWLLSLDRDDLWVLHRRFGTAVGPGPRPVTSSSNEVTRRRKERAALQRARQAWQSAG